MGREKSFASVLAVVLLGLSVHSQQLDTRRDALKKLQALISSAPITVTAGPLQPFPNWKLEILNSESCQVQYAEKTFLLGEIDPTSIRSTSFVANAAAGNATVYLTEFHTTNYRPSLENSVDIPESRWHIANVSTGDLSERITASFEAAVLACGGKRSDDPLPNFVVDVDLKAEQLKPADVNFVPKNIRLQEPYHFCKEIAYDVRLEGLSSFERHTVQDGWILYTAQVDPDIVMLDHSRAEAHIKILEVVDPVASKCPAYNSAFPDELRDGPSNGWVRMHGYAETGKMGFLTARALDSDHETYCDHRIVITNRGGDNSFSEMTDWRNTLVAVDFGAQASLGLSSNVGSNIGLTLYGRFVNSERLAKHPERYGCTGVAPAHFQPGMVTTMRISENAYRYVYLGPK